MKRFRFVLLLLALAAFGMSIAVFHPAAEEVDNNEPATVSDAELQTYIKVYTAMQEDHDLTIDNAIIPHHMSLDDFRHIERRIQTQSRLVERVREALLESAKAHSVFAASAPTPTPSETPAPAKARPRKKH